MPAIDGKIRVLIVDDDWDARHSLGTYLSYSGMAVELAATPDEAKEIVQTFRPAVVISDLAMPEAEDGLELIRELHHEARLPVIAVTALSDPDVRNRAFSAGSDRYFVKPINPSTVLSSVRQVVADP